MWEKIKSFAKWVWNWITVLVATILGFITELAQYIDQLTGLDWSQVMTRERAAAMIFWTALVKTIVTIYANMKAKVQG